jgi:hypothetical protein
MCTMMATSSMTLPAYSQRTHQTALAAATPAHVGT